MTRPITGPELHALLGGGGELALLDAREQGAYSHDHLCWAISVPLSHLESKVATLVPQRETPVVWCDADEGLARRRPYGCARMDRCRGIARGIDAWPGVRYSGVNVPSKAFGEWTEHREGTPHISAADLAARVAAGDDGPRQSSRPAIGPAPVALPEGSSSRPPTNTSACAGHAWW